MPQFIALLRGVNVGGRQKLPMAELRALLTELGGTEVRTLLNSGNAVFRHRRRAAAPLAAELAAAIHQRLGLTVPTVVVSEHDWRAIVDQAPFTPEPEAQARTLVGFALHADALALVREPLLNLARTAPADRLAITDRALYLTASAGLLDSPLAKALLGRTGQGLTTRNWATVLKLQALLAPACSAGSDTQGPR